MGFSHVLSHVLFFWKRISSLSPPDCGDDIMHLMVCVCPSSCSNLPFSLFGSCSGSGEDSLDRLLPPAGAPRRKSTTSLSKTEPPLLRTGTRTIYTAGRPPWYDEHGAQSKEAFVIGITLPRNIFTPRDFLSLQIVALSSKTFLSRSALLPINTLMQLHMRTARQH